MAEDNVYYAPDSTGFEWEFNIFHILLLFPWFILCLLSLLIITITNNFFVILITITILFIIVVFIHPMAIHLEHKYDDLMFKRKEKPSKIFKVNKIVELRLIQDKTYIYVKGKRFIQCMYLLMNIPKNRIEDYSEIKNIDEIAELLDNSLELQAYRIIGVNIDPETEFIGHCSNIQVFFENGLDTDLLHSNIAFPLLKKLVEIKYKPAYFKFREEIVKRFNEGNGNVREFLHVGGYLGYLKKGDFECLDLKKYSKIEEYYRF